MGNLAELARNALNEAGVTRSWFVQRRSEIVTVLILAAVAIGCVGNFKHDHLDTLWPVLMVIPATLAFVLSYWQWRSGVHEASFEQYYARLKDLNALFTAYQVEKIKAKAMTPAGEKPDGDKEIAGHLQTMFNFGVLDNVEYMLGKLRLGYVKQGLAERMVREFAARCIEDRDDFRNNMMHWVGEQDADGKAGYEAHTRVLVRYVIRNTRGDRRA